MTHHSRRQFESLLSFNVTVKYSVATFGDGDAHLGSFGKRLLRWSVHL